MPHGWIPDAELEVLKQLWEKGTLTARGIAAAIYGEADASNLGTVQKLLQRLEKRACVRRDRTEYVHRFDAAVTQADVAASQLDLLASRVSDGSLAPFVTHLVRGRKLSAKEKAEIRRILDE